MDCGIMGPRICDEEKKKCWEIAGNIGDVFRVEFRRKIVGGVSKMKMFWEFKSSGKIDFVELTKGFTYGVVGFADKPEEVILMEQDDRGIFSYDHSLHLERDGPCMKRFQIVVNMNGMTMLHPNFNDATNFDDHQLCGPDSDGADKYWTIGLHPQDQISRYDNVIVYLKCDQGKPSKVWWERYETQE